MVNIKNITEKLIKWIQNTVGDNIVVIGISGGKDSSITAALCVEALGRNKVFGVYIPDGKVEDTKEVLQLVTHLGIGYMEVNIGNITKQLKESFLNSFSYNIDFKTFKKLKKAKPNIFNDCYNTNTPARIRMSVLYGVAVKNDISF